MSWTVYLGDRLADGLEESGFKLLQWQENSFRTLSTNKPINDMSDLKGVKIRRTWGKRAAAAAVEKLRREPHTHGVHRAVYSTAAENSRRTG